MHNQIWPERVRTAQYEAIAAEFESLQSQESLVEFELKRMSAEMASEFNPAQEVDAALKGLERVKTSAGGTGDFATARELFELVDAKLFLQFRKSNWGKRTVYSIGGGHLNFGAMPPPVKIYEGRTGRVAVQMGEETNQPRPQQGEDQEINAGGRSDSLGNVSRGDRTPIELFCGAIAHCQVANDQWYQQLRSLTT